MKKRRFQSGGLTQADIDAGLTQADIDAGLRAGRNERITEEDRARALMNAARDSESIVDRYRDYNKNPEAEAFPVDMGDRSAPRSAPRATPSPAPRATPAPRANAPLAREPLPNEIPSVPAPAAPRRTPPSRGSYDRPGPIGDLIDIIRRNARRGSGNPNPSIYRGRPEVVEPYKKGGSVKKKSSVSSASKRGDGIATKGKTKGRMI